MQRYKNNYSFKVLQEKKSPTKNNNSQNIGVYEFTFDPSEEPPQKKKRKQTVRKKAKPKPKPVFLNNNYEKNITKSLKNLKATVKNKAGPQSINKQPVPVFEPIEEISQIHNDPEPALCISMHNTNTVSNDKQGANKENAGQRKTRKTKRGSNKENVAPPMVAKFNDNQIDYSPLQTRKSQLNKVKMSAVNDTRDLIRVTRSRSLFRPTQAHDNDPLNLLPDDSFEEPPIASSSMNMSTRLLPASPWRAEFSDLPIKWQANSHVKPNMTPSVETSFVISAEKKKHVYTNLVPENEESFPDLFADENEGTQLKQTSILEFIREKAQQNMKKKQNERRRDGPFRANIPMSALNMGPSSDVVNKMFTAMTTDGAPKAVDADNSGSTDKGLSNNASENSIENNEDTESVHLFEDVDFIHHVKPSRKSYGKAKKLTFCQNTINAAADPENELDSDDEEQDDATFRLPSAKTKKPTKKKKATKLTKKEEQEADAWAAAFNSMCEEVEDFPLVLE